MGNTGCSAVGGSLDTARLGGRSFGILALILFGVGVKFLGGGGGLGELLEGTVMLLMARSIASECDGGSALAAL